MIETGPESQGNALVQRILEDAKRQADALEAEAEASVRSLEEHYQQEARKEEESGMEKARNAAGALRSRILGRARVDARNTLLRAREAAVKSVLDRLEQALLEMHTDKVRYRAALRNLLVEGVLAVDCAEVVVLLGTGDRELVNDEVLEELREHVRRRSGREVRVDVEFSEDDLGGGCIVMERGGRVRVDNTIPGRMRESTRQLRLLIAAELEKNRG